MGSVIDALYFNAKRKVVAGVNFPFLFRLFLRMQDFDTSNNDVILKLKIATLGSYENKCKCTFPEKLIEIHFSSWNS